MKDASGYCYASTPGLVMREDLTPWRGRVAPSGHAVPGTEPPPLWAGLTVACLASGPSLTVMDVGRVHTAGLATVVTNDTFKIAPFAQAIFAADQGWWQQHIHEITIPAQRWTTSRAAAVEFDLNLLGARHANRGAGAIRLAMEQGAARVILLGYDCSLDEGLHWHGAHTRTFNPDAAALKIWREQFEAVAEIAKERDVEVLNCSRRTALECFECADLDNELEKGVLRRGS